MSSSALPVKTPPYVLGPHTLRMGHPDSVVSSKWSLMDRPGNLPPSSSTFCHLTITRNHHMEWHVLFNLSTKHLPTGYQCAPPVLATFISVRPRWCAVLGHSHLQTNSPGLWFKVTEKLEAVGTSSSPSVVKTRIITRGGCNYCLGCRLGYCGETWGPSPAKVYTIQNLSSLTSFTPFHKILY